MKLAWPFETISENGDDSRSRNVTWLTLISVFLGALAALSAWPVMPYALEYFGFSPSYATARLGAVLVLVCISSSFILAVLIAFILSKYSNNDDRPPTKQMLYSANMWFAGGSIVGIAWSVYGLFEGTFPSTTCVFTGVVFLLVLISTLKPFSRLWTAKSKTEPSNR